MDSNQNEEKNLTPEGRLPSDFITPRLAEEFESVYRKEQLMTNKIMNDRQCVLCKVVSGTLFAGFGLFHAYRVKSLWTFFPLREKVFNLFALGVVFLLSGLSFNAAK